MTEVCSRLEGDLDLRGFLGLDQDVRRGYQGIRMKFTVKGEASDEELEQLLHEAKELSPVFCSVSRGVPIAVTMDC